MPYFLSDASKVLVRNLELFRNKRCLLVNNSGDQLSKALAEVDANTFNFSYHFGHHQTLAQQVSPEQSHFGVEVPSNWQDFDVIILYWPKEKPLANYLLQHLLNHCKPDAVLYCVGPNKEGVRSAPTMAKKLGILCNKIDAAKHCILFALPVASLAVQPKTVSIDDLRKEISIEWNQQNIRLITVPGVFSANHLDDGTALLLNNLPSDLGQHTLDFGCGCGVIATALAMQNPQKRKVIAVDVNAFAIYATQATLAANNVTAEVYPVNGIQDVQQTQLSAIVTNPPFHQGVKTHYQVTEDLIRLAPKQLQRHGQLVLVANRFLQYPDLLQSTFNSNQRLAETTKFVVYQSRS